MKAMIIQELSKYRIYLDHLYSITSDSGSNIVRMIELLYDFYRAHTYGDLLESDYLYDEAMTALMQRV